ncbi:putative ABC transporter [Xylariaceae sp. FL0594]|nr:putative ABC transporter [Xylariaceae sp. FL0594]
MVPPQDNFVFQTPSIMAPDPRVSLHLASTACAAIFILGVPYRLRQLRRCRSRSDPGYIGPLKAVLGILLSVTLSLFWPDAFVLHIPHQAYFLSSLMASIIASLGLSVLLFHEQSRYHKPSDLPRLYLLCIAICDAIYLTLPTDSDRGLSTRLPVVLRCVAHTALFLLECWTRPRLVDDGWTSAEEANGMLGRAFFTWINPFLIQGYKNVLVDQDLTPLNRDMKPALTRRAVFGSWSRRAEPSSKKTLPLVLLRSLKKPFVVAVLPRLFLIVFRYSQPILIKESIRFVTASHTPTEDFRGFWLIISAVCIYLSLALSTAAYQHSLNKLKLMTRSAIIGLIHDKIMKSPSISHNDGHATTLMSTDAESLDGIGEMIHETWGQLVEVTVGIILLAREVGWIWPLPLFLIYLCSHMSRFVAKHLQPQQKAWIVATQSRIAATSSMLSEMRVVKMLGFQSQLTRRIQELRKSELWQASKLRWMTVYYNASANALGIFSPALTLAIFAVVSNAQGRDLDTETAFTTVAILGMITHPANMIMTIVPRAVSAFAGFERIQSFLLQPTLEPYCAPLPLDAASSAFAPVIDIHDLAIGAILESVNIQIASGTFVIISGPTGSGKTTLLRSILGEAPPSRGTVRLVATQRIAYCAQRPWLPSGTIREVIYGARGTDDKFFRDEIEDRDEDWYREVIEVCSLTRDFGSLPDGDRTQVGSRGLNLSGGQRQRVTLARALFARREILLLDDIFSGLDGETESAVFYNLFGPTGLVRRLGTTVLLVSNASQYFDSADHIVVLGDRGIVDQGVWANVRVKPTSISKFSLTRSGEDDSVLTTNFARLDAQVHAKEDTEADLSRRTGDPALYTYYFRSTGLFNLSLLIATTASYGFFITIPQYWLKLWTDTSSSSKGNNNWFYIGGYLFLSTMSWASTSTQMWAVAIRLAPRSGTWLHDQLLHTVVGAPLSYFSQTENGSILNRFSQDIQLIDKQLPSALQIVVTQIFKLLMQIILLCLAQKWLAATLPACMAVLWVVQKIYLRTSRQLRFLELQSRAGVFSSFLDSIEGLETIRAFNWSGAFIQQNIDSVDVSQRPEFLLLCLQRWLNLVLDLVAAAVAVCVIALAIFFYTRGSAVTGGQVGVALNVVLVANTTLLRLVESYTNLENALGAIARVKMLGERTPVEGGGSGDGGSAERLSDEWPSRGNIRFRDVTAGYRAGSDVLRNINLDIGAGQKLVVCGRTGSGKSTLLSILLRLIEPGTGTIELDGIDIRHVPLETLRQRCFVTVSQDPLLLHDETLRFNLDPGISSSSSSSDDVIVEALYRTGLWKHFSSMGTPYTGSILDQKMSALPSMSVGQCQLFALCRGLVKAASFDDGPAVVLLDEVTSSLDTETEETIHEIIDQEFTTRGHTVVMVAHRVGGMRGYLKKGRDAVMVMRDGRVVEVVREFEDGDALGEVERV